MVTRDSYVKILIKGMRWVEVDSKGRKEDLMNLSGPKASKRLQIRLHDRIIPYEHQFCLMGGEVTANAASVHTNRRLAGTLTRSDCMKHAKTEMCGCVPDCAHCAHCVHSEYEITERKITFGFIHAVFPLSHVRIIR